MRYEQIVLKDSYHITIAPQADVVDEADTATFRSAPAAPDIPVGVGRLIVASYIGIVIAFAIGFGGGRDTNFALTIVALFVAIFLTVPRIFLGVEPKTTGRPSLDRFLSEGMMTYTGRTGGKAALAQILIVPLCLILAGVAMSVVAAVVG
jgi:hypothetical protein